MWSLALRTLIADRGKLATAMVGVVFSVVLVNVQGGLFNGLLGKIGLLVNSSDADIWVAHKYVHNIDFPLDIPKRWMYRIRAVPGVALAVPYVIGYGNMTLPSGGFEGVVVVGCDRKSLLGGAWSMDQGSAAEVRQTEGIIVDCFEEAKLEYPALGEVREISGRRARVVAKSRGIVGFMVNPYVFTNLEQAASYLRKPADRCSYFLVKLRPGADAQAVCREINRRIPEVDAFPSAEYARNSIDFWLTRTGLGISFGAATMLGLLVGLIIVAQTLYASVLDRLSEFGAMKAMGASERQIYGMLLAQAITMALAGSLLGLEVVFLIQRTFSTPHAPIVIPWWLSLGSFGLVLAICLVSSVLPYLRIRRLDPAIVLRG
ncbi:MAG TPA: ABC transporter permease [Pirellulales bacterium]|nr:ABC transporter permease [Pirellulales bacterium]